MAGELGICPAALLPDPLAPTPAGLRAAVDAATAAGFDRASFWSWHLPLLTGGGSLGEARAFLDARGLQVTTVEASVAWPSGEAEDVRTEAEGLLSTAAAMGAGLVLATCLEGRIPDRDLARRNLGYLVELAARADVSVCVEFLPWSAIPDLATAWELVEPLGPGAGIVVDAWHWQRQPGGPAPEVLASIPPERILFVQLCDAAPEPSGEVMHEALTGRLPPGQGAVDFAGLFGALDSMSARPVVAAEIFNPALLAELGVAAAAVAMHDSCVAALGDRRLEGGPRR